MKVGGDVEYICIVLPPPHLSYMVLFAQIPQFLMRMIVITVFAYQFILLCLITMILRIKDIFVYVVTCRIM